jgi:methyl-accepting chemotaxis protein
MFGDWTFGRKIAAGFALTVALALAIGVISVLALQRVVDAKDEVLQVDAQSLVEAGSLALLAARKSTALRGFLLAREDRHLAEMREQQRLFGERLSAMQTAPRDGQARRLLDEVRARVTDHDAAIERAVVLRRSEASPAALEALFESDVSPRRDRLAQAVDGFSAHAERALEQNKQAATKLATNATEQVIIMAVVLLVCAILSAIFLVRTLGRQVGTAVAQVQSSSAELQAAANQQATASREQATAMAEISTTITELLATSRQIAESAQRVAGVAEQTSQSARTGDETVERAHQSIAGIRRQVDLIVGHMLDLGKKSQQIGSVLEIVSELAEQTNILAINATIEAAGAGESGRRFAVVADEIRKLADRVTGSTKEIRALIEDVRNSVNTTVMTTESGSKAVDAGGKQFSDVAAAFKHIGSLLTTTTEAAREIGLSTKQQASAVEQVNVAITSVAQATKETEASSGQTLQTASQLSTLSRELLRLVQPDGAAPHVQHG